MAEETLIDRWIRKLKNQPLFAALLLAGFIVTSLAGLYNNLPEAVKNFAKNNFHFSSGEKTPPKMGWVFAGYTDKDNRLIWSSPPRIRLIKSSGASDRPHIFRTGDIVVPLKSVRQVIVNYRSTGTLNQMKPPWTLVEEIRWAEDWTGRTYEPGVELEVLDVTVSQLPEADWAVWLRVEPLDK